MDMNAWHVDMLTNWRALHELDQSWRELNLHPRLEVDGHQIILDALRKELGSIQTRSRELQREYDLDMEIRLQLEGTESAVISRGEERTWARERWSGQEVGLDDNVIDRMRIALLEDQNKPLAAALDYAYGIGRFTSGTNSYEEERLAVGGFLEKFRYGPKVLKETLRKLEQLAKNFHYPVTGTGSVQYPHKEKIDKALSEPYKYKNLDASRDAIRLVRVNLTEGRSGAINCNLEHHNIRELVGNRSFHAISYVWGSSARTEKVLCDDEASFLHVTSNLHDVLNKLALEPLEFSNSRLYWIDGICINQEDEEERGHQVRKMANIYRRAACVHIFLGSIDRSQSILRSQWLSRRWVIQEAVAAQKVIVHIQRDGRWEQMAWNDFVNVVSIDRLIYLRADLLPVANLLRGLSETKATRWSGIFSLLLKFHATKCHDDRDRLYALLGVSSDVELKDGPDMTRSEMSQFQALKIWFQPSYTLSTAQVYHKFAVAAIRSMFAFDLLHCAGAFRCTDTRDIADLFLPSWVPDWRHPPRYKPLLRAAGCHAGILKGARTKKTPGQRAEKHVIINEESNTSIAIKGLMLGKVDCFLDIPSEPGKIPLDQTVKVEWFPDRIDLSSDRKFVLLDSGFTAYVLMGVRLEDDVVIPIGARTPFVLRAVVRTDRVCYELVGDCYVLDKDVMDGTYIQPLVDSPFTEFRIV